MLHNPSVEDTSVEDTSVEDTSVEGTLSRRRPDGI
jgi:hypothetical protein